MQGSERKAWIVAGCLGVLAWVAYTITLKPSVGPGDSGELITVAYTLGVAHPPGYPLYTLLAKIFTLLPMGSIAWRVNLFSAFCSAGAGVVLLLGMYRWTGSLAAGLVSAGVFCFSPLVWKYATVAEVFALNNLLVAVLFFILVQLRLTEQVKYLYAGALVIGLGLSHHHTLALYAVPWTLCIFYWYRSRLLVPKFLLKLMGLGLLGLTPYLYLLWAAQQPTLARWGNTADFAGLWAHFFRTEYGTFQLGLRNVSTSLGAALWQYIQSLARETWYWGVPLFLVGIWTLRRETGKGKQIAVALLLAYVFYVWFFHGRANLDFSNPLHLSVVERFWQLPHLVVSVFVGWGFWALSKRLPLLAKPTVALGLAVTLVLVNMAVNFPTMLRAQGDSVRRFGAALLESLPTGAVLLTRGDLYTFPLIYLRECENLRRDVAVLDRELMKGEWYKQIVKDSFPEVAIPGDKYGAKGATWATGVYDLKDFFTANAQRAPVFFANLEEGTWETKELGWRDSYDAWPWGLVNRVYPRTQAPQVPIYIAESGAALARFEPSKLFGDQGPLDPWDRIIYGDYWDSALRRGTRLLEYAMEKGKDPAIAKSAALVLQEVANGYPNPNYEIYKRLGIAYNWALVLDPQLRVPMLAAWEKFVEMAPPNDPDLPGIRAAIEQIKKTGTP